MSNWALDNDLPYHDPFRGVHPLPAGKSGRDAFTPEECLKILFQKRDDYAYWLANFTAAVTGLRFGEVCAIRAAALFEKYTDAGGRFGEYGLTPVKTKESVKIPVSERLFRLLKARAGSGFVFGDDKRVLITNQKANFYLSKFTDKTAKAERGLSFHSRRKFYNTYLRSRNITDAKIKAVMGHSIRGTDTKHSFGDITDVYTSRTPDLFPEVYEAQERLIDMILDGNPNLLNYQQNVFNDHYTYF